MLRHASGRLSLLLLAGAPACGPTNRVDPDAAGGATIDAANGTTVDAEIIEPPPATDVEVVITADNAYSFGYGDADAITTFIQGSRAQSAGEIFNCGEGPETYLVPAASAPASAYLYVVTWDDLSVTQGVLGQFTRVGGTPLYTGDPLFEACATGIDMQASQTGPTQVDINAQIALCNAGTGDDSTTSSGWVNGAGAVTAGAIGALAVGEANADDGGATFPLTCPTGVVTDAPTIDGAAHWMWYAPTPGGDAFHSTGSNSFRAYLIFRVAADDLPPID